MKQIAKIDEDVLPDADIIIFFEVKHDELSRFLKLRNRETDQDKDFMKSFETQNFYLKLLKNYMKIKE